MGSQQTNPKVQDSVQGTPQDAPPKEGKAPTEAVYTETQWRDIQSNLRKSEAKKYNDLQAKYEKMVTENIAIQSQLDDKTSIEEALKGQIADFHSQIEEGLSDEGKTMFNKLQKENMGLRERVARGTLELGKKNSELVEYRDGERKSIAENLAQKTGIDKEILLQFKDVREMKAYAFDNFDTSQPKVEPKEEPKIEPKLPRIETPVPGGTPVKTEDQVLKEMYPTMFPK